jgi:hypothetical protein
VEKTRQYPAVILPFGLWALTCAAIGLGCEDAPEPAGELRTEVREERAPIALTVAEDGSIALPSGLVVRQHELRLEPQGAVTHGVQTVRLRYVSEQLADEAPFGFERIEQDFLHLCHQFGLSARGRSAPMAEQIIISMASAPTAFGESVPEVVQYFDSFRVENDRCIWEGL